MLLYLVRLADVCGIDLGAATLDKLAKNSAKYPPEYCRGSALKYTHYSAQAALQPLQQHPLSAGTPPSSSLLGHGAAGGMVGGPPPSGVKKEVRKERPLSKAAGTAAATASGSAGSGGGGMSPAAPAAANGVLSSSDEMKRKRFNPDQAEALTALADSYSWSLSLVPADERSRVCEAYGISKERLQNFFNNRKPQHKKNQRSKGGEHSGGGGPRPDVQPDLDPAGLDPRPRGGLDSRSREQEFKEQEEAIHAAEQLQNLQHGMAVAAVVASAMAGGGGGGGGGGTPTDERGGGGGSGGPGPGFCPQSSTPSQCHWQCTGPSAYPS